MARKRKASPPLASLASIRHADLADVVGGRIAVRKGPDPSIIQGLQGLTESVAVLQQKRAADDAQQQQMMGQVMQQMMAGRG